MFIEKGNSGSNASHCFNIYSKSFLSILLRINLSFPYGLRLNFFCGFHVYRSYVSVIIEDVIQLDSDEDNSDSGDPFEISKGNETATKCTEF